MRLLSSSPWRRYTTPTCWLEVTLTVPPLARWRRQPVIQGLQFRLQVHSTVAELPIQVGGDRALLEALAIAVTNYIQRLLVQPPQGLPLGLPLTDPTVSPLALEGNPTVAAAADPGPTAAEALPEVLVAEPETGIALRPRSLLAHELVLGPLATAESGPTLSLSATQLFDLATVLETAVLAIATLPSRPRQVQRWVETTPIWVRSAAIVVFLVGFTSGSLELTNRLNPAPTTTLSQRPELTTSPPAVPLLVPPPPPPGATVVPVPSPLPQTPAAAPTHPSPNAGPATPTFEPVPLPDMAIRDIPAPAPIPKDQDAADQPPTPPESGNQAAAPPETAGAAAPTDEAQVRRDKVSTPAAETAQRSAYGSSPQVEEVRQYFARRWKPPAGLEQSLEYTLVLNPDGSIQRTIPLGKPAEVFLDRTPMPLANEPFVSPLQDQGNPKIRLILGRDGQVQSFLEAPKGPN